MLPAGRSFVAYGGPHKFVDLFMQDSRKTCLFWLHRLPPMKSTMTSRNHHTPAACMNLGDVKLSQHTDQQALILTELSIARKKLEEDNQRLRDELADAYHKIGILKRKLKGQRGGKWWDKAKSGENSKLSKKDTFRNPITPGKRSFPTRLGAKTPPSMIVFPSEVHSNSATVRRNNRRGAPNVTSLIDKLASTVLQEYRTHSTAESSADEWYED